MKRVFVTRQIPDEGIKLLRRRGCVVDIFPKDRQITRRELLKTLRKNSYDALLTILTDKINDEVLRAAVPSLKVIANYAVGFDNIDLKAAKRHKIIITNAPGPEISEAVAEHTIALMFALLRRIVESDSFVRRGKHAGFEPQLFLGSDFIGKTIGIVGMGRIGEALARRLYDGFHIKILFTNATGNRTAENTYHAKRVTLNQLLKKSDIVSLHVPLTKETRHLIGKKELAMMRSASYLINTARGPVVDEIALINALQTGEIAGAALDVFEHEPYISSSLLKLPNVVLTPHIASATVEVRQTMSRRSAENILAVFAGKTPPNLVEPS
ncbi:MAG: D-glycerate dehydrogenase [Patescibacteria group bacterium]